MEDLMKENNVFNFRYNAQQLAVRTDPNNCFDGILLSNGIMLIDTYWSSGGRQFTLKEAQAQGTLKFLCNLEEMQEIKEYEAEYFDDVVILFIHAGYRKKWLIKKGQERSKTKMLESIEEKINTKTREFERAKDAIERLIETKLKIESGDLSVYIIN